MVDVNYRSLICFDIRSAGNCQHYIAYVYTSESTSQLVRTLITVEAHASRDRWTFYSSI